MIKTDSPENFLKSPLPIIIWTCSTTCFLLLVCFLFSLYSNKALGTVADGIDFNAYLTGASVLRNNPKSLYSESVQKEHQKSITKLQIEELLSFRNTPLVAAINLPYTFLRPRDGYLVNHLIQIILLVVFILYLRKLTGINGLFVPIFLLFAPSIFQPMYGQIAIVIAFLYALIFNLFKSEKYFLAGLASSLFMLKFQYLIAIPYLLIFAKDKRRFLIGLLISSAGLILLDSLIYGSFYLTDYISFLIRSENSPMGTNTLALYNVTAFLRMIKIPDLVGFLASAILIALTLLITWVKKKELTPEIFFACLVLWNISTTPHSALVDLIFLLLPITIFIKISKKLPKLFAIILFFIPLSCYFGLQGIAGLVLFIIGCVSFLLFSRHSVANTTQDNLTIQSPISYK